MNLLLINRRRGRVKGEYEGYRRKRKGKRKK